VKNLLTAVTAAAVEICAMELVVRSFVRVSISVLGRKRQIKMAGVGCE
jgi:hypothetical protein